MLYILHYNEHDELFTILPLYICSKMFRTPYVC